MSKPKSQPKRAKPGSNRVSAAQRRKEFVAAYLANGRNATQAAITAGYSAKSARVTGPQLLLHPAIKDELARMAHAITSRMELSAERTLREIARIAYADARSLYDADGKIKPMSEWSEDIAAAVASVESAEINGGAAMAHKIKLWDKSAALEKAMKYLDLYRPEPPVKEVEPTNDLEIARRIWFVLDRPLRKRTVEPERLEAPETDG